MDNITTSISFTLKFNFSHVSGPRKIRSARPTRKNPCMRPYHRWESHGTDRLRRAQQNNSQHHSPARSSRVIRTAIRIL